MFLFNKNYLQVEQDRKKSQLSSPPRGRSGQRKQDHKRCSKRVGCGSRPREHVRRFDGPIARQRSQPSGALQDVAALHIAASEIGEQLRIAGHPSDEGWRTQRPTVFPQIGYVSQRIGVSMTPLHALVLGSRTTAPIDTWECWCVLLRLCLVS